jgi:hypothetical protein
MIRIISAQMVLVLGLAAPAHAQDLHIDTRDFTGGVGRGAAEAGAGYGGYGPVIFARDTGNGPTYNSYGQSFPYNPSRPGPFQPRLMGGLAPRSSR